MFRTNFTLPQKSIDTIGANNSNQISKEYYNFLVGEINRGTMFKAVCSRYYKAFDYTSYHLISI